MKQWHILTAESPGVLRDENGVPVEWTLFSVGMHNFYGVDGDSGCFGGVPRL